MASCHPVCTDNTSRSEAGVPCSSHHCLSRWCVISQAVPSKKSPSTHLAPLVSSVLFGKGPEKQSSRPCTTASHYQSHLPTFVFAFAFLPSVFFSISSPFNCLLLSLPLFSYSCVRLFLSCSSHLALSSCISLLLVLSFPLLLYTSFFSPCGKNSYSFKSKSNLHYPTPSIHPLITHSTQLA